MQGGLNVKLRVERNGNLQQGVRREYQLYKLANSLLGGIAL